MGIEAMERGDIVRKWMGTEDDTGQILGCMGYYLGSS